MVERIFFWEGRWRGGFLVIFVGDSKSRFMMNLHQLKATQKLFPFFFKCLLQICTHFFGTVFCSVNVPKIKTAMILFEPR